jgi:hypothetical protein
MEHSRLIDLIKATAVTGTGNKPKPPAGAATAGAACTVVADIMAGVGPFAVPLSMAKVRGEIELV